MRHTLDYIVQHYGDITGYLLRAGLSRAKLAALSAALVD